MIMNDKYPEPEMPDETDGLEHGEQDLLDLDPLQMLAYQNLAIAPYTAWTGMPTINPFQLQHDEKSEIEKKCR